MSNNDVDEIVCDVSAYSLRGGEFVGNWPLNLRSLADLEDHLDQRRKVNPKELVLKQDQIDRLRPFAPKWMNLEHVEYRLSVFYRRDCTSYLSEPAFWAVHLLRGTYGMGDVEEETVLSALRLNERTIIRFYRRALSNERVWPYFQLHLPQRGAVRVAYENFPEDPSVVYSLRPAGHDEDLVVANGSGNFAMPGFRFEELCRIGKATARVSKNPALEHVAFLLLYPAYWLAVDESVDEVKRRLSLAFLKLGLAPKDQLNDLREELTPVRPLVRWSFDVQLGWTNNGDHTLRGRGGTKAHKTFLTRVNECLTSWGVSKPPPN